MTDRELLELAAKAAGIEWKPADTDAGRKCELKFGLWLVIDGEPSEYQRRRWNPRTDDGDCARLEAALSISIGWWEQRVFAVETVANGGLVEVEKYADHAGDKQKARRHAAQLAALA